MAFVHRPIVSPLAQRSEQLSRLVYELLDAHSDTERLVLERRNELHWRAHLNYLRDLQRLGRAVLAEEIGVPTVGDIGVVRLSSSGAQVYLHGGLWRAEPSPLEDENVLHDGMNEYTPPLGGRPSHGRPTLCRSG